MDPGVQNFGVLFMRFSNHKLITANQTLGFTPREFSKIQELPIISFDNPVIYFRESNDFRHKNVTLHNQLQTNLGFFDAHLIIKYGAKFEIYEKPAKAISSHFGLSGLPKGQKKKITQEAFRKTFKENDGSIHVADAFAAGACIINLAGDSNLSVEPELKKLVDIFTQNVHQASELYNSSCDSASTKNKRAIRTRRREKDAASTVAHFTESSCLDLFEDQEPPGDGD